MLVAVYGIGCGLVPSQLTAHHRTWFRERSFDSAAVVDSKSVPQKHPFVALDSWRLPNKVE